eukprot:TRINITY_DN30855_c0_g1_i1.p1 TRINITY_DN30855_c0_g1~~TRINITY_DN30855_c0_g1_i1.p1  ORF type:complete len:336 (-),score=52.12 TRINITY_DN30855_c0_g1_i1:74-1081(-)
MVGKGGGSSSWQKPWNKFENKAGNWQKSSNKADKQVWVGNLPPTCTYQDLLAHAKMMAGDAKWAEVYKEKGAGTGAVGFATAEDATQAIALLDGSKMGNAVIQCDAWKREKKSANNSGNSNNSNNSALIGALLSQASSGKGDGAGASNKVWVGNLPATCTYQQLLAHARNAAGDAKWAEVYKERGAGTGAVGFASPREATLAAALLNGSRMGRVVIQCDTWKKEVDNSALINALLSHVASNDSGSGNYRNNKVVDSSKTIWVGNLPSTCTYQQLLTHARDAGNAKWAEVYKQKGVGTGAVGFATPEEAAQAIIVLHGTTLGDSTIECDAWAREKK